MKKIVSLLLSALMLFVIFPKDISAANTRTLKGGPIKDTFSNEHLTNAQVTVYYDGFTKNKTVSADAGGSWEINNLELDGDFTIIIHVDDYIDETIYQSADALLASDPIVYGSQKMLPVTDWLLFRCAMMDYDLDSELYEGKFELDKTLENTIKIKLLKNIDIDRNIGSELKIALIKGKTIELDLNGYMIDFSNSDSVVTCFSVGMTDSDDPDPRTDNILIIKDTSKESDGCIKTGGNFGVYIANGNKFILESGNIYAYDEATFINLDDNTLIKVGSESTLNEPAIFIMKGGELFNSYSYDGAVYVQNSNGVMIMTGGKIRDNSSITVGGINVSKGKLYMSDGEVINNKTVGIENAACYGAGITNYMGNIYLGGDTAIKNNIRSILNYSLEEENAYISNVSNMYKDPDYSYVTISDGTINIEGINIPKPTNKFDIGINISDPNGETFKLGRVSTNGNQSLLKNIGADIDNQYVYFNGAYLVLGELEADEHKIMIPSFENGSVNFNDSKAAEGDKVELEVVSDEGYALDTLTVVTASGASIDVTDNSFIMPNENVIINATFIAKPKERIIINHYSIPCTGIE